MRSPFAVTTTITWKDVSRTIPICSNRSRYE
jgi:hypothetical protein